MSSVKDVMTSDPVSCHESTSLHDVAVMMKNNDCGSIPVVDQDGKPVGTVTDRDIVIRVVAANKEVASGTVKLAMSSPVKTIAASASVKEASELMEKDKIRRLPVVDDAGKLVGMLAIADIALNGQDQTTAQVVKEVSEPGK